MDYVFWGDKMSEHKWEEQIFGNFLLHKPDDETFTISFQSNQCLGGWGDAETDKSETAIIDYRNKNTKYWILNGDYRRQYEELYMSGIEVCMEFFREMEGKHRSSWTTEPDLKPVNKGV